MTLTESDARPAAGNTRPIGYCVDIGGSFIKFGRAYGPGQVREEDKVATPIHSWELFTDALRGLLAKYAPQHDGLPLAICTTGLFDTETGAVNAANIPCFAGHDLVTELSSFLGRKVLIANDADSFALAEATVGAGKGHDVVMAIILGTGVGGGLVVGGSLVQGPGGVTGEWGHGAIVQTRISLASGEIIDIPRFACGCGRAGCTDTIGGARGIERIHRHLTGAEFTSRQIVTAWTQAERDASRTMAVYFELLAEPLAFAVNTVGANIIPVGGGLASSLELVTALDEAVRARTLHTYTEPLIVPGHNLKDGGLVGVSVLAAQAG